ncbi:MAG: phosphoserine phosphatase SerB [Ponticaulis sp.]|nr:phosphoserine phosphatase SerB [Ponticaulis sp.]
MAETYFAITVSHDGEALGVPKFLQKAEARELGPGALEFTIDVAEIEPKSFTKKLIEDLGDGFDVCVMPAIAREKSLLICDMDSTVIGQECIDELADFADLKDRVSAITERAMRGELDFEEALTERVALLKGLSEDKLERCFEEKITLNPGIRTLTATMTKRGATCLLVSGGFTFFTSRVAAEAGFSENYANTLLFNGAELSGEVGRPILGRQAKLDRLNEAVERLGLNVKDVLAMGDGANDLAMIEAAGLGVGFHPHPVLAEAANAVIRGPSLAAALYFQGIPKADWVEID